MAWFKNYPPSGPNIQIYDITRYLSGNQIIFNSILEKEIHYPISQLTADNFIIRFTDGSTGGLSEIYSTSDGVNSSSRVPQCRGTHTTSINISYNYTSSTLNITSGLSHSQKIESIFASSGDWSSGSLRTNTSSGSGSIGIDKIYVAIDSSGDNGFDVSSLLQSNNTIDMYSILSGKATKLDSSNFIVSCIMNTNVSSGTTLSCRNKGDYNRCTVGHVASYGSSYTNPSFTYSAPTGLLTITRPILTSGGGSMRIKFVNEGNRDEVFDSGSTSFGATTTNTCTMKIFYSEKPIKVL